ncbi:nitroreductase/quinone reductase family protein [Streptomyces sp. NPDC021020]|uniref:nitroreductase/quinone reductase family protein n=1 Tax=Streptomyces sp. NPDC021020 TaxID=3365109 RepID=UPI0037936837
MSMSERLRLNQLVIDEFRSAAGVVGGDWAGVPLLLLTTTGLRSGEPRTAPTTYLADGERLVVFAANGGRPAHPAWYRNLLADPAVRVEVGEQSYEATAATADGAERTRLWQLQLAAAPYFAGFQERAGDRLIPVVVLTRAAG